MPELGSYGSVRGARGNSRPYREHRTGARQYLLLTQSGHGQLRFAALQAPKGYTPAKTIVQGLLVLMT
jgi:hypothetical protein